MIGFLKRLCEPSDSAECMDMIPSRRHPPRRWQSRYPHGHHAMALIRQSQNDTGRLIRLHIEAQIGDTLLATARAPLEICERLWLFFPPDGRAHAFERYGAVTRCEELDSGKGFRLCLMLEPLHASAQRSNTGRSIA